MLISKAETHTVRLGVIMSDVAIMAATIKSKLLEVAKQAAALGEGLQNAAPGDKAGSANPSVQYLLAISESLKTLANDCESSMNDDE